MNNIELYRTFLVVAESSNITKASKELHISQPAVTNQIKKLESDLGGSLFIRTKRGVILNDNGKKIYYKIKKALSLIEEAENDFKNIENLTSGNIKIGISTTLVKKYLSKYIKSFHELYPNILFEISTDPTSELIKLLKIGSIDFIIAKNTHSLDSDLEYFNLGKLENIFIANDKYSILKNKKITINELVNYPILLQKKPSNSRELAENYFKTNNIEIKPTMNIASSNLLIDFVKSGLGVGLVTKLYVDEELKNDELFEIDVFPTIEKNNLSLIKIKNNDLSFAAKALYDLIVKNK